jgi:GH35 family endo-1,4-beta-xylanase
LPFNLGVNANVFYLDNISVKKYIKTGGGQIIEKTPEEKRNILTAELERWIAGMMKVSKAYVKAWDVVNEPMDDGKPFELKTGVGKKLAADEFYWQDYIGKDYAVTAFKLAAQYGNSKINFINDISGSTIWTMPGLIAYVEYIESKGARVDGIGTQMHIDIYSDKEKITQMFQLLARTGKLIKISELDIGIGKKTTEATDDDYQAQAEMYRFVVEKYFELIPATQRYGITVESARQPEQFFMACRRTRGLWTESINVNRLCGFC